MHFIHPTAINTVHYGPHAKVSTFLVTARTEKKLFWPEEVTRPEGSYLACTRGPRKRRREKSMKVDKGQMEQVFFSLVSCPYMQQTSSTKLITGGNNALKMKCNRVGFAIYK